MKIDTINLQAIPAALVKRQQWLMWKFELRGKNATKVPYQPNGAHAKSNDQSTWSSFTKCKNALKSGRFDGIGFVFSKGDNLTGIDLDHCFDINGKLEPWAREVIAKFSNTYIEKSPSGEGLHIWCYGNPIKTGSIKWLKPGTQIQQGIEIYNHNSPRYFTVTGQRLKSQWNL